MIVIDYVDGPTKTQHLAYSPHQCPYSRIDMTSRTEIIPDTVNMTKLHHISGTFVDSVEHSVDDSFSGSDISQHQRNHRDYHNDSAYKSMRGSSDSSSAYSGSDTMHSMQSSVEVEEVDLTGLMESVVDSDEEEDLSESMGNLTVRDAVRDCLEKDPSDRTEDDLEILLEFTQHLKAFTNMTHSVRRALVATMVFAVVEKAGTIVMTDGEELDSWSVIINGHVEVESNDGDLKQLHLGDSFGITPTMDKLYHSGVMRTKCDDCQFVCITQTDYYRILHQGEENQRRHEKDGEVVLVTEHRTMDNGARKGHIVIRGIPERLMAQLVEDNSSIDPTYIEDFLLTHRTFVDQSVVVADQLLEWFQDPILRDKVTRVLLLWVNNHFTDFETDPSMMEFLERFEAELEKAKMHGQLRMLNFACTAKARKRTVTLTRPSRDDPLQFQIVGGYEKGFGIFISKVEHGSKAEEIGLKKGDQILEVNGQSFEHGTKYTRALEVLKSVCHLSITVKSNLLAFQDMLHSSEDGPRSGRSRKTPNNILMESSVDSTLSNDNFPHSSRESTSTPVNRSKKDSLGVGIVGPGASGKFLAMSSRQLLNRAFNKFLNKPKSLNGHDSSLVDDVSIAGGSTCNSSAAMFPVNNLASNGEYKESISAEDCRSEYPEHVLKVFKADQTCKYLLIHKETTAHEVVMLSLQEFGITEPSTNYTLCEVSVAEGGFVKQRTLPDQLKNLAERIGLASRYYIKNIHDSETLLPDENTQELQKESHVALLQLNPVEVSTQLMVEDFTIFRQIEATEYVEDLFEIVSRYGTPNLTTFSALVNREMMWVISEIVAEQNIHKRVRVIKQFIKIARQCKETQNFNSMFAIVSGLGHGSVLRLKSTWEKIPSKYQRLFNEMQQLMDPSRNMSRYRNLINAENVQPPIIPFFPVVKKDLTFIHLGNHSRVDGMINFEKLRMIAKEVRTLTNMCSVPLDLFSMLELGGQQPSSAMVSMNQLTTGQHLANRRGRKKTAGIPNPKRMFEEAQMVRRVKAYLKSMKVITNEEELHKMSMECEPPQGGLPPPPPINTVRKRNPSPSPSAVSSASSTPSHYSNTEDKRTGLTAAPNKFGAASPQAVKKLLSLSEQSKPRHKSHPSLEREPPTGQASTTCQGLKLERVEQPTPVNLTSESSSVSGRPKEPKLSGNPKTKVRKMQNSIGSVTSTDSGFGPGFERLERNHSESPQLPPRRRYHQHYHRQHQHGPGKHAIGLSVHHAVPVEVCPGSPSGHFPWPGVALGEHQEFYPGRTGIIPRVHRITTHGGPAAPQTYYLHNNEDTEDDETQVSAV